MDGTWARRGTPAVNAKKSMAVASSSSVCTCGLDLDMLCRHRRVVAGVAPCWTRREVGPHGMISAPQSSSVSVQQPGIPLVAAFHNFSPLRSRGWCWYCTETISPRLTCNLRPTYLASRDSSIDEYFNLDATVFFSPLGRFVGRRWISLSHGSRCHDMPQRNIAALQQKRDHSLSPLHA
jgi:hypothetical protein